MRRGRQPVRRLQMVFAALSAALAVLTVPLAAPATASDAVYTYDAAVYVYDGPPLLSSESAATGDARGSPTRPRVASWEGSVSVRDHGVAANTVDDAAGAFRPPRVVTDRHGQLTNGTYTLDSPGMAPHMTGSGSSGKSQFLFGVDANSAVLDAAAFADANKLWVGNQARVFVENGPVGVVGRTGQLTDWLTVTRTDTGFVHGWPSNG